MGERTFNFGLGILFGFAVLGRYLYWLATNK
jgi:hypothetical protein